MQPCTIIIPIYNAYEVTKAAIDSVIENTNLKDNKLVLINDNSTDKRIKKLLSSYSQSNIIVMHNDENLGFVKTVNIGMKLDQNDVLLLNSDTEVTKNWLEKIKKCAYHDDNIATVTPLSNNATLASVPVPFVPSELPSNYSLEQMGELVEKCSYHDYPEIPTGHGFCLFIKRKVIEEVGYFDEEAFGKGYGEENDFCYRCLNYGYRHVLCDDTYIYHKESQSFLNSKIERMEAAKKIIKQRYPSYLDRLEEWCLKKTHHYIGDNISLALGSSENRINILFIIHDWDSSNLGGTTLHAHDIIQNLRKYYNFHVLTNSTIGYQLYSYYEESETMIQYPKIDDIHDLKYYNSKYQEMLENIIDMFQISILHIHHLKNHYFNIKNVIQEYSLYTIITLHDYYCICPQINKLYKNDCYCGNPSNEKCNECLNYIYKNKLEIRNWRQEWRNLLSIVNKVIVPNETVKEEIQVFYPNLPVNIIEHGINIKKNKSTLKINKNEEFQIAFIGSIGIHKGSKILNQLIQRKDLGNIRIHLFGYLDGFYPKNNKHYINHGKYKREDLKKLLQENNIQLVCLFSNVPETFSYTLSESIACGIPVLAFDIGAIGNRIKKDSIGWLMNSNAQLDEIIKKIQEISENSIEYQNKIDNINNYKMKSTKDMANDYKKIYQVNGRKTELKINEISKKLKENNNYQLQMLDSKDAWVFQTLKWKIVSRLKLPRVVKRLGKRIVNH